MDSAGSAACYLNYLSACCPMQVAAGAAVAREADTLRVQLAQLQVQQAQAETDIKGFMLAATGTRAAVQPHAWLLWPAVPFRRREQAASTG